MPCQGCINVFYVKPCESIEGKIEPSGIKNIKERTFFVSKRGKKSKVIDFVSSFYTESYKDCPCRECLVKIVCDYSKYKCSKYKDFLENTVKGSKIN
jgi:hypothetical protein